MASGNSTSAIDIPANGINGETMDDYEKMFKILENMSDLENGGSIDHYLIYFAIRDNEENRKQIFNVFGKNWEEFFIKRYIPDTDGDGSGDKYFLNLERWHKLTGAQAAVLITGFSTSVAQHSPDCWGDMLLSIIIVVVATYFGRPDVGSAAIAYFMAAIAIMHIVTRRPMSKELQYAMIIYGGYQAYTNWESMSLIAQTNAIVMPSLQALTTYENHRAQKHIDDVNKDIKAKQDEYSSSFNDAKYNFMYYDIYDNESRTIYSDPHKQIRELYIPYTIHPELGMDDQWIQLD